MTEGLTGWQFLRTGRWIAYMAAAVVFAVICGGLTLWQYDRGREASADNSLYSSNFAAPTMPLSSALPALDSYSPQQVWRAVSMKGTWDSRHQYYLRNVVRSGETGFDVITAFRVESGETFLIDRGWVAASADMSKPVSRPAPPGGDIDVVARLQPSQAKRGEGGVQAHQIESVDLSELAPVVGGSVYSQAWGVLVSPRSSGQGLGRIQVTPPAEGVGYHYSYMIQWILFALIGFFLLWRGAIREYRRLNADDPAEQQREAERVRKQARKAFTDEEIEDESLDGYLPLTRWTGRSRTALGPTTAAAKPALTGTPIPFEASDDEDVSNEAEVPPSGHGHVLVLGAPSGGLETPAAPDASASAPRPTRDVSETEDRDGEGSRKNGPGTDGSGPGSS